MCGQARTHSGQLSGVPLSSVKYPDNYKIVMFSKTNFSVTEGSAFSPFERTDILFGTGRTRSVESQGQRAQVFVCRDNQDNCLLVLTCSIDESC